MKLPNIDLEELNKIKEENKKEVRIIIPSRKSAITLDVLD